nr:EOG090X0D34 [Artemia franciscana]
MQYSGGGVGGLTLFFPRTRPDYIRNYRFPDSAIWGGGVTGKSKKLEEMRCIFFFHIFVPGLFGAQPAVSAPPLSVGSTGLGGTSLTLSGQGGKAKQDAASAAKENKVENEIMATVESFRSYVKSQKSMREEIARARKKNKKALKSNLQSLEEALTSIDHWAAKNNLGIKTVLTFFFQELQNVEMAQRTQDTPQGLQMENTQPMDFFFNLIEGFERKIHAFRQQIEEASRNMQTLHQMGSMSAKDLIDAVKKLHESFVTMASRLYYVHREIQTLRDGMLGQQRVTLRVCHRFERRQPDSPDFADDVGLMSSSSADLQKTVNDVSYTSKKAGLMISKSKTKVMKANAPNHPDIQLEGETIDTVEEFYYLGSILTPNGGAEADVELE